MNKVELFLVHRAVQSRCARIGIHLLALTKHAEDWSRARAGIIRELHKFRMFQMFF